MCQQHNIVDYQDIVVARVGLSLIINGNSSMSSGGDRNDDQGSELVVYGGRGPTDNYVLPQLGAVDWEDIESPLSGVTANPTAPGLSVGSRSSVFTGIENYEAPGPGGVNGIALVAEVRDYEIPIEKEQTMPGRLVTLVDIDTGAQSDDFDGVTQPRSLRASTRRETPRTRKESLD